MSRLRRRDRWGALLLALVALVVTPGPGAGQVSVTAVLRGEVRDSAGAALADAEVVLRDLDGRVVARAGTDAAGRYVLVGLPPGGPYELTVERLGYASATRGSIRLAAGQSRRLDVVLGSAPLELAEVRVVAAPDLVFSGTRTGAVTVLDDEVLESLPTVDRDVTGFALLSPLAAADGDAFSIAGQNTRFNALRVDGAIVQDLFGLSPSGVPGGQANAKPLPLDAIGQYSVLVAPYDVRQSGFTGGLMNAVTRRGGDRWTASAHGYYRDTFFSRSYTDDRIRSDALGEATAYSTEGAGFTVGGPLAGARLLVAGEYEARRRGIPGFHLGTADPTRVGLVADSVDRVRQVLSSQYDLTPGTTGDYALENPLVNLFARLDVPLGADHDLTVRYNGIAADEDRAPNRLGFDPYELGSGGVRLESRTHAVMTRFASRPGSSTSNELMVNVQRTADRTLAASDDPRVEVHLGGTLDGRFLSRRLQAGGAPIAHANELDLTLAQLVDNLSHARGDHLITLGVEGTWMDARRRFLPASRGIWRFDSLAALEANTPSSYERLVLPDGVDPDVEFEVLQIAGYVQDEWSITDGLGLTMGVRVDVPMILTEPAYNPLADSVANVVTSRLPSPTLLASPRLGFNWSPNWERRTQVRGGVGIFTATPPLAWLADAYAGTGLRAGVLVCEDSLAPGLADPAPAACADGSAPIERRLTYLADDFRYPRDLRVSLAVDQELAWGVVATVEGIFTRAVDQISVEDRNLVDPDPPPYPVAEGYPQRIGPRLVFGEPLLITNRFSAMAPGRRWEEFGHVIRVGNHRRNAAVAVAGELQRRFEDRLGLRLAYTYTRAVDVRSLRHESAALNYGHTPVRLDPREPEVRPSSFGRPHRVLASVRARLLEWGDGLDVTALYVGQSGLPYSYVYSSDVNGDGFPGPGVLSEAYNDLFLLPAELADVPGSIGSTQFVFQLLNLEECLHGLAGFIAPRNECRTPWSNRLDLRLSQALTVGSTGLRVTADITNVLNLLNPDWGLVYTVPPVVPIFELADRDGCPGQTCRISLPVEGRYIGPRRLDPASGDPVADRPYTLALPESLWRAQLGVRVAF